MGGIIDFGTSCPWELYLFSFCHIGGAIVLYLFDSCRLLTSTSCTDAEKVFESFTSLSMLYVGVIFSVLTYHNKTSAAKITRLSNFALNGAVAMLCAVIFAGNDAYYGGIERCKRYLCFLSCIICSLCVSYGSFSISCILSSLLFQHGCILVICSQ